jgi:phosphate/sulfate permease
VVTSIAGAPASSIGAAIGAISGVVRAKARSLSAVVWRGDAKINVTVEIPPITKLGRKDAIRRGP